MRLTFQQRMGFIRPSSKPGLPVMTGVIGWYDAADDTVFDVSSGAASVWRDKSGNNYHGASGGTTPVRTANSLNGKPTVDFTAGYYNINMPADTKPFTLFAVISNITDQTSSRAIIGIAPPGTVGAAVYVDGNESIQFKDPGGFIVITSPVSTVPLNQGNLVSITYDAAGVCALKINNNSYSNTANNTWSTGRTSQLGITNSYGNEQFKGSIAEIIKYNRVLSGAEITSMEGYLKPKWGLP